MLSVRLPVGKWPCVGLVFAVRRSSVSWSAISVPRECGLAVLSLVTRLLAGAFGLDGAGATTLAPASVMVSSRFSGSGIGCRVAAGFATARWACSFCELMGRKKALDVREGTWLLLAVVDGPPAELAKLPRLGCRPAPKFLRTDCEENAPFEEAPVLVVSGWDVIAGLCGGLVAWLSSPATSVIRDDTILAGRGA